MNNKLFLGLLLCSLVQFFSYGARKHPNIILVLTDDQGYGDLTAHGSPDVRTPNIDRLISQSISFEDFHVSPTCAPTRAAIMSGCHPFKGGVTHTVLGRERLDIKKTILPQVMKRAGYTTGIFGKWHLGDIDKYQPHNRGFDEVLIHGAGGIGQDGHPGASGDVPGNNYQDPILKHNNTFVQTKGFCTDIFFKHAMAWMKSSYDKGKPFFAYIATNAPHGPYLAPASYKKRFADMKYPKAGQGYFGMIENIDDNVGLLMEKLDAWGMTENTILIFMSDNGRTKFPTDPKGEIYNAGMKGLKKSPHQGGTRVPFVMRWTGHIKAGTKINNLFCHYDLLPTFADVSGIDITDIPNLDGESFLPYVTGEKTDVQERYRFVHSGKWGGNPIQYINYEGKKKFIGTEESSNPQNNKHEGSAVRTQQYRFVNDTELYDIRKDPGETNNIIEQHPELVAKLRKKYNEWWNSMMPFLINEKVPLHKEQAFRTKYETQLKEQGIPNWKEPKLD